MKGKGRREKKKKKKQKRKKMIDIKKVAEEWEIWDEKEEEARRLVPKQFHKWIKVFGKKASEKMTMRKI